MPEPAQPRLMRVIGRWSLAALMVNIVIGSGIFGLPAVVAGKTGRQSPWSFVIAAFGIAVIAACFAEVASRFRGTGGPYLYTREAFGRFVGLQTGWVNWLSRLSASAANANLFPAYLATFWPRANHPGMRLAAITILICGLAAANIRGVKMGTTVSNLFTASKLTPLIIFVVAGCAYLTTHGSPVAPAHESYTTGTWLSSVLLVIFAYAGFEAALIPAGEMAEPDRDAPAAILAALGVCAPIYVLIQIVVVRVLTNPAGSDRPLAAAASIFGGPVLTTIVALGALLSCVGFLAAGMIACPRITYAFAEQREFPRWFAAVHPRYRTPYISIVVYAALVWALAAAGTFSWNAKLSAVSRLIMYSLTCAALPKLRRKRGEARFRLPVGTLFSVVGVGFCLALLSSAGRIEFLILVVVFVIASLNWLLLRLQPSSAEKLHPEPL